MWQFQAPRASSQTAGCVALGAVVVAAFGAGSRFGRRPRACGQAFLGPGVPVASPAIGRGNLGVAGDSCGGRSSPGPWAASATALAAGALAVCRSGRRRRAGLPAGFAGATRQGLGSFATQDDGAAPVDLYGLLGVEPGSDERELRRAYVAKQKLCHPDVAGPDGEDMCILLNDAYDTLSDPTKKRTYDEAFRPMRRDHGYDVDDLTVQEDLDRTFPPTWKWIPKVHNAAPVWKATPRSISKWDKLDVLERGEKWAMQQFVFVDEWRCISCRNCCEIAPKVFTIEADTSRARVFAQWGNSEEYIDYAVASCPVDCIYWVSRSELQMLEHVTVKEQYEKGSMLACSMAMQQGIDAVGTFADPFEKVERFRIDLVNELKAQRRKAEAAGMGSMFVAGASDLRRRIQDAFDKLNSDIRGRGWGGGQ